MMYICKIRSAPPSSPPSPPSAPVATPARACPSGSAPPVIVTMMKIIKTKTITRGMKIIRRRMLTLLRWLTMPAPMESPKTLIAVRNLNEKLMFQKPFYKVEVVIGFNFVMARPA